MKSNVGEKDKVIRIILSVIIAGIGIYYHSWWGIIAIVPLITAFMSFCPLYSLFGMNTCSNKTKAK
jgi:Protein of unknown function (DUF2892)